MDKYLVDLVYRSFDGKLSAKEQMRLKQGLDSSPSLKELHAQLGLMREKIALLPQPDQSGGLTENVMRKIQLFDTPELFYEAIFRLFKPVASAAALFVLLIAIYNMASSGDVSIEAALAVPDISLEETFDPLISLIAENE